MLLYGVSSTFPLMLGRVTISGQVCHCYVDNIEKMIQMAVVNGKGLFFFFIFH